MAEQVFLYQQGDCDLSNIEDYIHQLHQVSGPQRKIQFISALAESGQSETVDSKYPSLGEYVIGLCRCHNLLSSSRLTVLSQEESVQALQLCLAHRNKQKGESFDIEDSKVFEYHQKMMAAKLTTDDISSSQASSELAQSYSSLLSSCLHVDLGDIFSVFVKELQKQAEESELQKDLTATTLVLLGVPRGQMEKQLLEHLCGDKKVMELFNTELAGDSASFSEHSRSLTDIMLPVNQTPTKSSIQSSGSIHQMFSSQVLLSYLHILVNSRSELSLAKIFNFPDRELDRQAFTDLKHEAKRKNMSMFQTATSFLMRIRLGGKGYAPDLASPLNQHTKGLGDLIDLIHNLQTVAEEQPDIRIACRRLLNIVKNRLIKCPRLKLKREDVEEATTKLYTTTLFIIDAVEARTTASPDKPASEGGSLIGRRTLRIIRLLLDKMAATQGADNSYCFLNDLSLNPTTPTRVPCLLTQFRSPELLAVQEETPDKHETSGLTDSTNIQAYENSEVVLPCGEKIPRKHLNSVIVFPSKTVAHPAPETAKMMLGLKPDKKLKTCAAFDKENIRTKPALESEQPTKKRRLTKKVGKSVEQSVPVSSQTAGETQVELSSSQSTQEKKKTSHAKKGCRRRLMPQVKGQQKLTGFFRV